MLITLINLIVRMKLEGRALKKRACYQLRVQMLAMVLMFLKPMVLSVADRLPTQVCTIGYNSFHSSCIELKIWVRLIDTTIN